MMKKEGKKEHSLILNFLQSLTIIILALVVFAGILVVIYIRSPINYEGLFTLAMTILLVCSIVWKKFVLVLWGMLGIANVLLVFGSLFK